MTTLKLKTMTNSPGSWADKEDRMNRLRQSIENDLLAHVKERRVVATPSYASANISTSTAEPSSFSLADIEKLSGKLRGMLPAPAIASVVSSPFAVFQPRAKAHIRRRGQSEQYHKRVDKKWLKRYGLAEAKPGAYIVDMPKIGSNGVTAGTTLIIHEHLLDEFKRNSGKLSIRGVHPETAPFDPSWLLFGCPVYG